MPTPLALIVYKNMCEAKQMYYNNEEKTQKKIIENLKLANCNPHKWQEK